MGLFGSIGKVFGGALKIAGKVAGVASAVAPIPGLGFAGKVASSVGGALSMAKRADAVRAAVMPGGTPVRAIPQVISTIDVLREAKMNVTGNVLIPPSQARVAPSMSAIARPSTTELPVIGAPPAAPRKRRRKKKRATVRRAARRRSTARRKKKGLTRAQLRAGFGGKRRMRRR